MATKSPVNTKQVTGRRALRYESFAEILADAESMAVIPTRILGNWSVGQIYKHLAKAADVLIDGPPFAAPLPIRWILSFFLKKRMLFRTLDAGFKLPLKAGSLFPEETTTTAEGLQLLRTATARIQQTNQRAALHPAFGKCTVEEWNAWHCRHSEMHMSFIVPVE